MSSFRLVLITLFLLARVASAVAGGSDFRPALVGNGPKALVNLVDTNHLLAKGQRDAMVFFTCYVDSKGRTSGIMTYGGGADAKPLAKAVQSAIERCRFIPAIYRGNPTSVEFNGTAAFFVTGGKPHLRIYSNQSSDDLSRGSDFIAPQLIGTTADVEKINAENLEKARITLRSGTAQLDINVDLNGFTKGIKIISEDPPDMNIGRAGQKIFQGARLVPGFRNGHAVECSFRYTFIVHSYLKAFEQVVHEEEQ